MAELTPEQVREAALRQAALAQSAATAAAKQAYEAAVSSAATVYQQAANVAEAAYAVTQNQQAEALAVYVADATLMQLYETAAADLPAYLAAATTDPVLQEVIKAVWCLVRMKGAELS